jgi:transposase-like protein
MSTKYSKEFKESMIARMLPPENVSVPDLVRETGIPKDTLYTWRSQYRNQQGSPAGSGRSSGQLSNEDKLAIIIETAPLSEVELGEYCRRKGLYPEQIASWKKTFIQNNAAARSKVDRDQVKRLTKLNKTLQSELNRKEKALAEAAALLVLEKKLQALLEDREGEKSTSRSAKK